MLLRDHYYSDNKYRIVEIKKFSIGAGTTAVLMPKLATNAAHEANRQETHITQNNTPPAVSMERGTNDSRRCCTALVITG